MAFTRRLFSRSSVVRPPLGLLLFLALLSLATAALWIKTSLTLASTQPGDLAFIYPGSWQLDNVERSDPGRFRFDVRFFRAGEDQLISHQARLLRREVAERFTTFEFQLEPDDNWFELRRGALHAEFHVSYAPASRFKANANSTKPNGFVSLGLMGTGSASGKQTMVKDWVAAYRDTTIPASLHIPLGLFGESSLSAVALRYFAWLEDKKGWPDDNVLRADVNHAFELVNTGKSKIWCGNIANLYMLLSQHMGLDARPVMLIGMGDDSVATGGHVTNETYLPSLAHWQLTDFTLGVFRVTGADGFPMNAAELHQVMATPASDVSKLVFDLYEPLTDRFVARTWDELPHNLQLQLRTFYGNDVQLFYRYHPTVGMSERTLAYRVVSRLFGGETMYVLAPRVTRMSFLTWSDVREVSRVICLVSLAALLVCLMMARSKRHHVSATIYVGTIDSLRPLPDGIPSKEKREHSPV